VSLLTKAIFALLVGRLTYAIMGYTSALASTISSTSESNSSAWSLTTALLEHRLLVKACIIKETFCSISGLRHGSEIT